MAIVLSGYLWNLLKLVLFSMFIISTFANKSLYVCLQKEAVCFLAGCLVFFVSLAYCVWFFICRGHQVKRERREILVFLVCRYSLSYTLIYQVWMLNWHHCEFRAHVLNHWEMWCWGEFGAGVEKVENSRVCWCAVSNSLGPEELVTFLFHAEIVSL